MNKKDYSALAVITAMSAISLYAYSSPHMQEQLIVHWNARGQADGYSTKAVGLFMMPALTLAIYGMFLLIPKIEVFKENMKSFIGYYDNLKVVFALFMLAIQAAMILQNTNWRFNMNLAMLPAIAMLLYYIGHMMPHVKRNFFVGIRTPWTLANDRVWEKTHVLGGKTFRLNAVAVMLGLLAPETGIWLVIGATIANALLLMAYSYWLYQKEGRNQLEKDG
jgi:uncharacterized membrane protein